MKNTRESIVVNFPAGEDLKAGEAVWLCKHQTTRSPEALTTVRRILHGSTHTALCIGVTKRAAREGRLVPIVMQGFARVQSTRSAGTAWATEYGEIVPWLEVRPGAWAADIGKFTDKGMWVELSFLSKKKSD